MLKNRNGMKMERERERERERETNESIVVTQFSLDIGRRLGFEP